MSKIDLTINREGLAHNIQKAKENNIIIPTIAQMQNPDLIPEKIKEKLTHTGLWDVDPVNLFRINWHNEAKESGGLYQKTPNYVEIPSSVSGVPCRILAMSGKWFPTGCHKVGASFGCLAPRLVTGQFDATYHHAVWPSTGNYCRGGAFNSKLLACDSVAILPQDMSKERFDWLKTIAGQIIATPGCESNVKEIFDKTWELKQDPSMMIFNQFAEMGNPLWHYNVTGYALSDLFENVKKPGQRLAGACFTSGSAGTMSAGDLLKERYPGMKLAVGEALQCPTILDNGFGGHRIEGIGDKHIPWIHNVKNTDMAIAIDDEDSQRLLRLFNTAEGKKYLKEELKLSDELIEKLTWLGISGIANVLCCIKMAKYYELTEDDVVCTVLTDSAVMYGSRIEELNEMHGAYSEEEARLDHNLHMLGLKTDSMMELTYEDRKRIHNLKYYTWVEQQARDVKDLNALWYDVEGTWDAVHAQAAGVDVAGGEGAVAHLLDGDAAVGGDHAAGGLHGLGAEADNAQAGVELDALRGAHEQHVGGAHETGEHGVQLLHVGERGRLGDGGQVGLGGGLGGGALQRLGEAVEAVGLLGGVAGDEGGVELADDRVLGLLQVQLVEVAGGVLGNAVHGPLVGQDADRGVLLLDHGRGLGGLGAEGAERGCGRGLHALVAVDEVGGAVRGHAVVEGQRGEQVAVRDRLVDEALHHLVGGVGREVGEGDRHVGSFLGLAVRLPQGLLDGLRGGVGGARLPAARAHLTLRLEEEGLRLHELLNVPVEGGERGAAELAVDAACLGERGVGLGLGRLLLGRGEGLLQLGESRLVAGAFVALGLQLRLQLGDALVAVRDVALQLVDVGGVLALGRLGVLGLCALSLSGVLGLGVYRGVLGLCALGRGGACFVAHIGSLPGTRGASPLFGEDGRAALTGAEA